MALAQIVTALEQVEHWVAVQALPAPAPAPLAVAQQVVAQEVTSTASGQPTVREGVAHDRRISIEDGEMRHGRKSRSRLIDGYKRPVLRDLDQGLVRAVGLTLAHAPEATVTEAIVADLAAQQATLAELHIDRAYLSSTLVRERPADLAVYCKAWPVRNGDRFPKTAFALDWEQGLLTCPHQVQLPFTPGGTVHFPAAVCATCPLQARCTASAKGRSVHIYPDERLIAELRQRQHTALGRAKLRERVSVDPWRTSVTGRAGERATVASARTSSTCAGPPWCTTSSSGASSISRPAPPNVVPDGYARVALSPPAAVPPVSAHRAGGAQRHGLPPG